MDVRVIYDRPASGAWNMAVDEALLETVSESDHDGWLRFYRWEEPTLSLGYFQRHGDRQRHPPSRDLPTIRRSTGGGAIIHAEELTYSFCIPVVSNRDDRASAFYFAFHETFIEELASRGVQARICGEPERVQVVEEPFLCFLRRAEADVLLGEHKIGGSAQRRRRDALLQHGSMLLRSTIASPELAGVEDISGVVIDPSELAERWAGRIATRFRLRLHTSELGESEAKLAESWQKKRFGQETWTLKR
jgi:lipoate-protein ligase A